MATDKESPLGPAFLKTANEAIADAVARHRGYKSLFEMSAVDMPRLPQIDSVRFPTPKMQNEWFPTPKAQNEFQSAGVLVKKMAQTVGEWRTKVPENCQPVVLALLQGGVQMNVTLLAEESFHSLRIEGTIDGSSCLLLTHQASVQLLCFVSKVEQESQRRRIGFIIDGEETTA
jgi:hypothetical protein